MTSQLFSLSRQLLNWRGIYNLGFQYLVSHKYSQSKVIINQKLEKIFDFTSMATITQQIEFVPLTEEIISSLNCPVCFEIPNENQIYQCENGHTTCLDCCLKIPKKNCPQCRMEMFKTRFTNFVSNNVLPRYVLTN